MDTLSLIGLVVVAAIIGVLAHIFLNYAYHRPLGIVASFPRGHEAVVFNKSYIKKYAAEAGINPIFLAGAIANEAAHRWPAEDEVSLIDAIFCYPRQPEGVGIGHTYGIAQLHVYKARLSARLVYGQMDDWVLYHGEEDPPNPAHFVNGDTSPERGILHANYDRWHVAIASALYGRSEFAIKHAAGWAKLNAELIDPINGISFNNGDYYGSLFNLWLGHHIDDPEGKNQQHRSSNQQRIHWWMDLIKKEQWLDE
jgi:hypothetical protein